jgi:diamine N-acetyltransferase
MACSADSSADLPNSASSQGSPASSNEAINIQLRPVDRENWRKCVDLSVSGAQEHFVAENWFSLLEWKFGDELYPYCVYADETVVGFLMYGLDPESRRWGLWRFMIDVNHQNKGYGNAALAKLLELVRDKLGEVSFYTSVDPENETAFRMYENAGFEKIGEIMWDEEVMKKEL